MNATTAISKTFLALVASLILVHNAMAVPLQVNYQGNVYDAAGNPITGDGYFKFAIVNAAGTTAYWVNNGNVMDGSEPTNAVRLSVSDGAFAVKLGDTNLANMAALSTTVFDNDLLYLRVWFSTTNSNFEQFTSEIQFVSSAFAMRSATADRALVADSVTNLDTSVVQSRVTGNCINGETISAINQDGTVQCVPPPAAVNEQDPTVIASVKDGVDWSELSGIPAPFADGVDNVGITSEVDGVIGNEVTAATNSTLTRSGAGTAASPYTLGLNLASANSWTGTQTLNNATVNGTLDINGPVTIGANALAPAASTSKIQIAYVRGVWTGAAYSCSVTGIVGAACTRTAVGNVTVSWPSGNFNFASAIITPQTSTVGAAASLVSFSPATSFTFMTYNATSAIDVTTLIIVLGVYN